MNRIREVMLLLTGSDAPPEPEWPDHSAGGNWRITEPVALNDVHDHPAGGDWEMGTGDWGSGRFNRHSIRHG